MDRPVSTQSGSVPPQSEWQCANRTVFLFAVVVAILLIVVVVLYTKKCQKFTERYDTPINRVSWKFGRAEVRPEVKNFDTTRVPSITSNMATYSVSGGILKLTKKVRLLIYNNEYTKNALVYNKSNKTVSARNVGNVAMGYPTNAVWEYNPNTLSLCPAVDSDFCLYSMDPNDDKLYVTKWANSGFSQIGRSKAGKEWVINFERGTVDSLHSMRSIENGGDASRGDALRVYPYDNTPNKRWSFVILSTM
jgi:hypothetical protein